jgi:hypothetical protein
VKLRIGEPVRVWTNLLWSKDDAFHSYREIALDRIPALVQIDIRQRAERGTTLHVAVQSSAKWEWADKAGYILFGYWSHRWAKEDSMFTISGTPSGYSLRVFPGTTVEMKP